jgi:hypothetical protein
MDDFTQVGYTFALTKEATLAGSIGRRLLGWGSRIGARSGKYLGDLATRAGTAGYGNIQKMMTGASGAATGFGKRTADILTKADKGGLIRGPVGLRQALKPTFESASKLIDPIAKGRGTGAMLGAGAGAAIGGTGGALSGYREGGLTGALRRGTAGVIGGGLTGAGAGFVGLKPVATGIQKSLGMMHMHPAAKNVLVSHGPKALKAFQRGGDDALKAFLEAAKKAG